jgi:hypothetical protein
MILSTLLNVEALSLDRSTHRFRAIKHTSQEITLEKAVSAGVEGTVA